jgi:hypothetical protein
MLYNGVVIILGEKRNARDYHGAPGALVMTWLYLSPHLSPLPKERKEQPQLLCHCEGAEGDCGNLFLCGV